MKRLLKGEGTEGTGAETESTPLEDAPAPLSYSPREIQESRGESISDSTPSEALDPTPSYGRHVAFQHYGQYERIDHQTYGRCRRWMLLVCESILRTWNILMWPYYAVMKRVQPTASGAFFSALKKEQNILYRYIGQRYSRLFWIATISMLWGVIMIAMSVWSFFEWAVYIRNHPKRQHAKTPEQVLIVYFGITMFTFAHIWLSHAGCMLFKKIKEQPNISLISSGILAQRSQRTPLDLRVSAAPRLDIIAEDAESPLSTHVESRGLTTSFESSRRTQHTTVQSAVEVGVQRTEKGAVIQHSVSTEQKVDRNILKGQETGRGVEVITAQKVIPQVSVSRETESREPKETGGRVEENGEDTAKEIENEPGTAGAISEGNESQEGSEVISGRSSDVNPGSGVSGTDTEQERTSADDNDPEVGLIQAPLIAESSTNLNSGQESSALHFVPRSEDDDVESNASSEDIFYSFPPAHRFGRTLFGIPRQLLRSWLYASFSVHILYLINPIVLYIERDYFPAATFNFISVVGIGPTLDAIAEYYGIRECPENDFQVTFSTAQPPSTTTHQSSPGARTYGTLPPPEQELLS